MCYSCGRAHVELMSFFYVVVLSGAVGLDALGTGVAYGARGIHISSLSIGVVGFVTVVCVAVAMFGALLLSGLVDARLATIVGASILVLLGIYRLLVDFVTVDNDSQPHESTHHPAARRLTFAVGDLVIRIMARSQAADLDCSKHIDPLEAIFLGLALGIDNMVAASAATLGTSLPAYTPLVMALVQMAFISAGVYGADYLFAHHARLRLPYVAGSILILIGATRLVP